ncbi:hypothetical protein [Litorilituus lipolyticus]|uniref:Uncharacterized protein n=1 Tax=Litorilituus lipolyticus TaxID=2491017 RepID=A0A502KQV2_9GAMM|nr:hypothetical protein [Litorilituus lipolyticus]TPH13574.1 hypothetical protein EPA86_13305 [Litorilituus lipolyticus]
MSKVEQCTNRFDEPLNKVLEMFISVTVLALGIIAFVKIMTPNESSLFYPLDDLLRFGLFTVTLFLIMSFICKPLFNALKIVKLN